MAGFNRKDWEDLNITKEEVENLKEALKKEEFRKLLSEYADEITDPKNRKQYQDEIIQLEAERGIDCTFVNPEAGFVVKTSVDGNKKAFVNICKNKAIGRASSKTTFKEDSKGLSWSIPFSQSPGREDFDKKQNRCVVYDVVFHPDTLHLAEKSLQFKKLVVDTALSAIEDNFSVKLDKKNIKYPKMKFKGIPFATVIRKKSKNQPILSEEEIEFQKNIKYPAPPPIEGDQKPVVRNFDDSKNDTGKYTIPKYVVKHRSGIDLQEFTYDKNGKINIAIPKELVIEINLPLLNSTKEVQLDVMEKSVHLVCEKPAKYKLDIQLPYAVSEEEGNAKFDKDSRLLFITLPVIKAKCTIADLMREDSGVESDFGERCASCDDSSPVGSIINNDDKVDLLDDSVNNISPSVLIECDVPDDLKRTSEQETEMSEPFRTKEKANSFLDDDKQYLLPPYRCNTEDDKLCFILNVKNVEPSSVMKQMESPNSCHIKFSSLGSGFFPVFYAFLIKFDDDCLVKDVVMDVWDNNVTVQLILDQTKSTVTTYYVGVDKSSLTLKDLKDIHYLEKKLEKMKLDAKIELDQHDEVDSDNDDDDDDEKETFSVSVESADSEEIVIKVLPETKVGADQDKSKTSSSKRKTPVSPVKPRSYSESSTDEIVLSPVTVKSILKNSLHGSYSDSTFEDFGLGSSFEASEGSDFCIPEAVNCSKKTVRFNNHIGKHLFRSNASILAQKKKSQKRSQSRRKVSERKLSNSESEEKSVDHSLIEEVEEKNKEPDCSLDKAAVSEENGNDPEEEPRNEMRFSAKKEDKIFEFKSDLIFDLDM